MKTRSSFLKKKKTLIITLWLLIVLAIVTTLVVLFLKQDDTSKAAEIQEDLSTASGLQTQVDDGLANQNNVDGENQATNGENAETNPQNENEEINNQTNIDVNNENGNENNENGNENNENGIENTENTVTGNELNTNNIELQEIITFEDKLVSEDFLVGWTPISIFALASSTERNIHAPQLEIEKHSYSEREFTVTQNGIEVTESKNDLVYEKEAILYEITVRNVGNVDANNIRIYDMAPEQTTLLQVDSSVVMQENGLMCWTVNIPKYTEIKVRFLVTVNEDAKGTITNTALVNGEETNETQNPIIEISKQAIQTEPLYEGEEVEYIITVTNTGDIDTTINVEDEIPSEITYIIDSANYNAQLIEENGVSILKWSNISLEKEQTKQFIFKGTVNVLPEGVFSEDILNTALVSGKETNEVKNEVIKPNIIREKKSSVEGNVHENDVITYTIIAGNTGTGAKTIEISDMVPEGTTFKEVLTYNEMATLVYEENNVIGIKWNVTLEPQDSKEFKFSVKVNKLEDGTYTTDIKNKALVDNIETNEVINKVVKPCITRLKENSPLDKVREGETITYTITAGNIGTEAKEIEVVDYAPEGTTFTSIDTYKELATEIKDGDKVIGVIWKVIVQPDASEQLKFTVTVNNLPTGVYSKEITNEALVDKIATNKVTNNVVKPHITGEKTSDIEDGSNVKYGQEIEYTITVTNSGTEEKVVNIADNIPEHTEFVSVSDGGETIVDPTTQKVTGVKWSKNVAARTSISNPTSISVTFKVRVIGEVTKTISNTANVDGVNTNTVTHKIDKTITTQGKNTGKNIVVVLDLSSSMLNTAYGKEYLGTGDYYSDSKLELAKDALQTFTTAALAEDLGNTITLITFNYDSYDDNVKKALKNAWRDQAIADAGSDVHKHIGTKVLVSKTNNAQTINNAVEGIKLERPLLTNIYEALKLTNTTIDNLKASEPNKDVVVVFIGDGKSSYSTESGAWVNKKGDTLCKFDTKANTIAKITDICLGKSATSTTSRIVGIREKATVYTVEYNVPDKEKDDAREVFTKIASDSSKRFVVDANSTAATVQALNEKLTAIATDIGAPKVTSKTTNVNGIVTFDIPENANLFVSESKKLIVSLGGDKTPLEFDSIEAIGIDYEATGRIKYDETNKQIIIDTTKFSADSQISVQYYYSKQ